MASPDAIASILLERLIDAISKEIKRVEHFEKELNMMRNRFVNIKNLLDDKDRCNEPRVQHTLPTFRDLMYEADDILTDCQLRHKYQQNHELCSFLSSWDILFQLKTSRKIEDINKNMENEFKLLNEYVGVKMLSPMKADHDSDEFRWTYDTGDDIIGIDDDVEKIKGWIFSQDCKHQKIGIVGMGGLGKTTIAKIIFNDSQVNSHFDKKIWVSVSRMLQVEEILRSILQQLGQNFDEQPTKGGSKTDQMLDHIMSQLKKKSCLIILDDMWNNEQLQWWERFVTCSSDSNCECCFIITTRDEDVASIIKVEVSRLHRPKFINDADGWTLFSKKAFSMIKAGSEKLKPLGRTIVAKCKGLPLAIKAIRGLLGSTNSFGEWEKIGKGFCEANITKANAVMNSLQQSYKELPPHLKQCFLCFSIFPENVEIEAKKLIHWWIGEGLIKGSDKMSATEIGFDYLSKLVSRCLVEVVERRGFNGRVYKCKMHDLVRDLTILMAQDEKLCCFDNGGEQKLDKDSRWVGFMSEFGAKSLNQSPKLRALLLMSKNPAPFDRNLGSLGSLRALDLSNNELDNTALCNLLSWVSALKRLAYLNLTGSQGLKEVPVSICKLRNLQVFVLSRCINLSKLSLSITQLKNLIVLDLEGCDKLSYLPRGLSRLSQLQELSGLRFGHRTNRGSCLMGELGQLGELRVLQMHLGKDNEITEERDVLSKLNKLKVLAITFDDNKNSQGKTMIEMLDLLHPPPELEQLYLKHYYHDSLPKWVSAVKLCKLKYLCVDEKCLVNTCTVDGETTWDLEALHLN